MRSEPRQRVVADAVERPHGWLEAILGDVITLKRGYDLPQRDRIAGTVPVVSSSGIIDHHAESKVSGPGVVTGRTGTLGQVFFIPGDFWPLNTALYVQNFKGNDPRFISYLLKTINFSAYSDKAAVPGLNRNHLHEEAVHIPATLDEQRAIAHLLGTLDDKIEVNRRMNATLDDIARALFTSWFVHFDPVHAKAALTQRASPGGSAWPVARAYLDRLEPALAALFPDRFVDSALGPIPAKWELSTIGQETQAVGGGTPSTKEPAYWHDARHYWATPKDLAKLTSPVLLNTARKISDAGLEKISSGLLPVGTVLLSSRAPIGYLAMTEVPTAINQGFIALICPGRLSHWYVLHWCAEHLEAIKAIAGGSTFAEISKQTFRPLPVLIPPRPLLLAFDTAVRPLYRRTVVNMQESAVLAALRDTLLPKLLSGQIRVRDAAAQTSDLQEKGEQGQGR